MARRISLYIASILFASVAYAQPIAKRNDSAATILQGTDGRETYLATDGYGQLMTIVRPGTSTIAKNEDAAHSSNDAGVFALGVANPALSSFCASGDYCPMGVTVQGAQLMTMDYGTQLAHSSGLMKLEDSAAASGDAGVTTYAVREDALTNSTGTTGDYIVTKADAVGRQIVGFAPPGESWQSCGTATATTGDVAIKAAVASNRIYVTSIVCKNTAAATATSIDFKDGTTIFAVGGVSQMATTSAGAFSASFPIPLRGTVNTALNFATNISTSSVTCCAAGYISVL